MVAKKIFHVVVGFWFATKAFFIFYLIGAVLYAWRTDNGFLGNDKANRVLLAAKNRRK